jgi:hypothetical protein
VIFSAWTMCGVVLRLVTLVGDVVEPHIDGPADDDFAINPGHAVPVRDLLPSDPDARIATRVSGGSKLVPDGHLVSRSLMSVMVGALFAVPAARCT